MSLDKDSKESISIHTPRVAAVLREAVRLTYKVMGRQYVHNRIRWSEESKIGEYVTQIRRVAESNQFPLTDEEKQFTKNLAYTTKWAGIGVTKCSLAPEVELEDIRVEIGQLSNLADQMELIANRGDEVLKRIAKMGEAA